jgi:HD-GYP domain-containing protein (c-di-GMP phosphodiesterase class II)
MKKLSLLSFRSFRAKVTLVLVLSMLFVGVMNNFLIYKFALDSQLDALRNQLMIIAQTAALTIDADTLMKVPLNPEGANTPQYKNIVRKLQKIKEINLPIKYIYTMTKTEEKGIWQFIVDPTPLDEEDASYPGDKYNVARFPEMLKGFDNPSADKKLEVDEWGVTLSGYAPIRDKKGKAAAMLGVDVTADDVYLTQREIHKRAVFVLVLGIIFSLSLGMLISNRIADPIRKLAEGTRRIAKGDLQYQVEVKGRNEISELAHSFNEMAGSLSESRKKLHDYFYRAMESLVRLLEAKDAYTRGHSGRVAKYTEKIALKMNFPQEEVESLRKIAKVHDIGKLGIPKSILNKKEKLTEEDWKTIQEHPGIGEKILRPVVFNEEMLAIVRGHHERYDGKGYPDGIKGDDITISSQIVSVADTYDAMTSTRAYRLSLSKEEAIEELKKNSGIQFNSRIIEAFLKVLEQE